MSVTKRMTDQHAQYLQLLKIPLWHSRSGCDPAYEIEVLDEHDEIEARPSISLPPLPECAPKIAPVVAPKIEPIIEPATVAVAKPIPIITPIEPCVIEVTGRNAQTVNDNLATCQACQLSKARTHVVKGTGIAPAKLMIITEAPTLQEDIAERPLAGRAGQLFDQMLKAIDYSRDDVFITPYVKCAPLQSLISKSEEDECSGYLINELMSQMPERILILGRHAARAVLNVQLPFDQLRNGQFHLKVNGRAIPVQVSYNPYQLLKFPKAKRNAWQDMKKLIG
ncbi:uracil-DNA glycosylase [Wohlfahrtiimonas sp. G9077]|uniref:uracil-DNA glycosylase n=1 Tax=Wohlfahrtiimonas sp. G9077 TaxID=1980118 RepID=UPI001F440225|nr:uracil-DNA glycosylase [Wohlfahrtiimonas sp. G9077]